MAQASLGENEEDFNAFESKVNQVMMILQMMNNSEPTLDKKGAGGVPKEYRKKPEYIDQLSKDDFIVEVKEERTLINKNIDMTEESKRFSFMADVERDAARRTQERQERQRIAQNLRMLANEALRNEQYEKAIDLYTKAITHVKDSPVLYVNRALCYIRFGIYKRAIVDCDFVLNKLDEKYLRAWIYRANAFYMLGELVDYEKSIAEARKHNNKEIQYIDNCVLEITGGSPNIEQ